MDQRALVLASNILLRDKGEASGINRIYREEWLAVRVGFSIA